MTSTALSPEDFYGVVDVPYHRHLGVRFERPDPAAPATITLPDLPDWREASGERSSAAAFTAAEIAAALGVSDVVWPHLADDPDMRPMLLTVSVKLEPHRPLRGDIRTETAFVGDGAEAVRTLRARRKVRCTIEVRVLDDGDGPAADAEVDIYLRLMDPSRWQAMTSGGGG